MKTLWIENLEQEILSRDFKKIENGYELVKNIQHPGQTLSINGRVTHQPGKIVEIKKIISFNGDGWISDENDENKKEFTQLEFIIIQNNKEMGKFEEAFYWDDIEHFKKIFNLFCK